MVNIVLSGIRGFRKGVGVGGGRQKIVEEGSVGGVG